MADKKRPAINGAWGLPFEKQYRIVLIVADLILQLRSTIRVGLYSFYDLEIKFNIDMYKMILFNSRHFLCYVVKPQKSVTNLLYVSLENEIKLINFNKSFLYSGKMLSTSLKPLRWIYAQITSLKFWKSFQEWRRSMSYCRLIKNKIYRTFCYIPV